MDDSNFSSLGVRLAVREDGPAIMRLCRALHEENGLFSFSESKANWLMDKAFDQKGSIIGVIGEVGAPEASIYLMVEQPYYSEDFHLIELWNYVESIKGKRGGPRAGYARRLLRFAKACSDILQLPFETGILSNHRVEAKVRLYEREFEKAGAFFLHNRKYAAGTAWDGSEA